MSGHEARFAASLRVLLRLFTISEADFPAAGGRMRYNAVDFQTLHFVGEHRGCRATDLAAFLGVAPTTVQSALDRLEKRGLIARQAHPRSGRALALHLTQAGEAMTAAISAQDEANCAAMLSTLDAAQRAGFVANIERMADRLA
jgi:DNA-binding MarR family transcriptional regulator